MTDLKLQYTECGGLKKRPTRANGLTIKEMVLNIMINNSYYTVSGIKQCILFKYNEKINEKSIHSCLSKLVISGDVARRCKGMYVLKDKKSFL